MVLKKEFEQPVIEIINVENIDVLTASLTVVKRSKEIDEDIFGEDFK